jgi:hypothetical protein
LAWNRILDKVVRLQGDQIGRIFTYWGVVALGVFSRITELAQSFGQRFPNVHASYVFILRKRGWATVGRPFSQAYLVTLCGCQS